MQAIKNLIAFGIRIFTDKKWSLQVPVSCTKDGATLL